MKINSTKLLILLFLFINVSFAQINQDLHKKEIKNQAIKMKDGLLNKDYQTYSNYTYPITIKAMGGKTKFISSLKEKINGMEKEGLIFLNVTIGETNKILKVKNELQTTIVQEIELKVPDGKIKSKSFLIAISDNNGKNWFFIDTSSKPISEIKKKIPNLSNELILLPKENPEFTKD